MAIPPLNTFPPAVVNLDPTPQTSLPVMAWLLTQSAPLVPGDAAPWMLAQGWQYVSTTYDSSTVPPTPYFNFSRETMATGAMLQSLVNIYTDQFNDGRYLNAARYDNIVANWSSLIDVTIQDLNAAATASNDTIGIAIADLATSLAEVKSVIDDTQITALADYTALRNDMAVLMGNLAALESAFASYGTTLDISISDGESDLSTYQGESQIELAKLLTDYNAMLELVRGIEAEYLAAHADHEALYITQLDLLPIEYATHADVAAAYLVNLGTTELARINEAYDARLSEVAQNLTARGFYSAAILGSEQERVERERNEQITALNDRLAREKLENQHKLYEQSKAMRAQIMEGLERLQGMRIAMFQWKEQVESRLEGELTSARVKIVEGVDRRYIAGRDFGRLVVEQRVQRLGVQREVLTARSGAAETQMRLTQSEAEVMTRLAAMNMEAAMNKVRMSLEKNSQEMSLIRYQVDAQNNLIVGLFGFEERRFDLYPSMDVLARLCMSLGDSAATSWVSP
jgi:hypothetical protein